MGRNLERMIAVAEKEMPKYTCHKTVHALQIKHVDRDKFVLTFVENDYMPVELPRDYFLKHDPQPGGYFVVYKDGYKSFSPQEVFSNGYKRCV